VSSVEIYTSKEKQFKIILTQNILERVSGFFTELTERQADLLKTQNQGTPGFKKNLEMKIYKKNLMIKKNLNSDRE
jgi:hypothetical protein